MVSITCFLSLLSNSTCAATQRQDALDKLRGPGGAALGPSGGGAGAVVRRPGAEV
jgi:hypothetical protein